MESQAKKNMPLQKRSGSGRKALGTPFVVALALAWVLTFSAGLWWVAQSAVKQQQDAAVAQMQMLADQVSAGVEPLLASGELSAVRRLVSETHVQQGLSDCRLVLGDGRPLVDADLDNAQLNVMPTTWPVSDTTDDLTRVVNGQILIDRVVPVSGKGDLTLSLAAPLPDPNDTIHPMLPGAAVVAVVGLAFGLVLFRKMNSRLEVLTVIRGALQDAGDEAIDLSGLAVNPEWGEEAKGWNRLLAQKQMQEHAGVEHTLETMNARSDGGLLEDACEGLWTGLLLTDGRGRITYLNGAAAAALAIDQHDAIGMPLLQTLSDETLKDLAEQMLAGTGAGRVRHEMTLGEEGSPNMLQITLRRLTDSGGLVLIADDVTQQRVAEASRHDFVSRATHELRTPLTNIRLYVETAQDDGQDDPELRGECLNVISRESQRLERLVSEMMSVSEIEAGSMSLQRDDVRLDQLFKSLQQDYSANAKSKDIDLRFDLPPKLPAVQGDRDKLAIVLQNLLGNAIKYTPEGGEVSLAVDLTSTELNVEVRDSGIGISEEDQTHVFEKFYRANDPRLGDITGSGLGLALAHEIVRLHGGDLTVESELNEGSMFRITLPITAEGL